MVPGTNSALKIGLAGAAEARLRTGKDMPRAIW
jgi:hypothetical protein